MSDRFFQNNIGSNQPKEEITKLVNELLKNKIIKPSQSPCNTPVFIVPKKPDSHGQRKWRIVLDFGKSNEKNNRKFLSITKHY